MSGLGDGGGRLGLGASLAPWGWLRGLGLFDSRCRRDLRGSGRQAAGPRADLQHFEREKRELTQDESSVITRFCKPRKSAKWANAFFASHWFYCY